MMIFAIGKQRNNRAAFTLVELIMVMTMMVMVLGLVFPSLKGFFRGRNLNNEATQFLALTRYGQSRAITEGIPVELWINPRQDKYGLQALSGYTESRTDPKTYTVDQTMQIAVSPPPSLLIRSNVWTQTQAQAQAGTMTKIRFQPDGFISDTSPENIYFRQQETGEQIWIAETPAHLRYEIKSGQPPGARR